LTPEPKPLAEVWALTAEERTRLAEAPFPNDPEHWRWFAARMHTHALDGYAAGEVDLRRLLTYTRMCALGCALRDRITLEALMVERVLTVTPKTLNRRPPQYPAWVREAAGDLVRMLAEQYPDETVTPSREGEPSAILRRALDWLTAWGFSTPAAPIRPKTLYGWYRDVRVADGVVLHRGRRKKPTPRA